MALTFKKITIQIDKGKVYIMSSLAEFAQPLSSTSNILGGLDMVGFENKQRNLQGTEQSDSIVGGNLNDMLSGGAGFDFIDGKDGNDIIQGGDNIDFLMGGKGNDIISGDGGDDFILGGAGDDIIEGGAGKDFIIGGAGDDVITGGAGKDNLFGGEGKDTFVLEFFDNSADTINDFNVDEDNLVIKGVDANADVTYDKLTGQLSVDGQEIANLQPGLDFTDENYDIF